MSTQANKTEVVHFLVSQRKKSEYTSRLGNKVLYVTEGSKCQKLTTGSTNNVPDLESSHEKADTHVILHAKHANGPVIIHADDTDMMVLLLTHRDLLDRNCIHENWSRIKSKNHPISSYQRKTA